MFYVLFNVYVYTIVSVYKIHKLTDYDIFSPNIWIIFIANKSFSYIAKINDRRTYLKRISISIK